MGHHFFAEMITSYRGTETLNTCGQRANYNPVNYTVHLSPSPSFVTIFLLTESPSSLTCTTLLELLHPGIAKITGGMDGVEASRPSNRLREKTLLRCGSLESAATNFPALTVLSRTVCSICSCVLQYYCRCHTNIHTRLNSTDGAKATCPSAKCVIQRSSIQSAVSA